MFSIFILFFILIGLTIGSFANALIWRVKNNLQICNVRSQCVKCNHKLGFFDLIPIFSWIYLKGRCRYCDRRISVKYPINELIFGLGFFLISYNFLNTLFVDGNLQYGLYELFFSYDFIRFTIILLVFSVLMIISIYDILYLEIMDCIIIPSVFTVLILNLTNYGFTSIIDGALGAFVIYSFFYIQILIPVSLYSIKNKNKQIFFDSVISYFIFPLWMFFSLFLSQKILSKVKYLNYFYDDNDEKFQAWIGGGDLRMGIFMGLLLGLKIGILTLFVSYFIGSILGILLKIYGYIKGNNIREVPFIPFLSAGTIFGIFYGEKIYNFLFQ